MAQKSLSIYLFIYFVEHCPVDISHAAMSPEFSFPSAVVAVIWTGICQPAHGVFISPVTQDYVEVTPK